MDQVSDVIEDLLQQLAAARSVAVDASPSEIIVSSLDRMRFLVALEERLDTSLDVGDAMPFDLSSRGALLASVQELLTESGVVPAAERL
jgi:acyl carrier protein